jgi:hypothetical protein
MLAILRCFRMMRKLEQQPVKRFRSVPLWSVHMAQYSNAACAETMRSGARRCAIGRRLTFRNARDSAPVQYSSSVPIALIQCRGLNAAQFFAQSLHDPATARTCASKLELSSGFCDLSEFGFPDDRPAILRRYDPPIRSDTAIRRTADTRQHRSKGTRPDHQAGRCRNGRPGFFRPYTTA